MATTEKRAATGRIMLAAALIVAGVASASEIKETRLPPQRIVWMSDTTGTYIQGPEVLLQDFSGQVSVRDADNSATLVTTAGHKASILLDFGKEIYGGLKIYSGTAGSNRPRRLRVCLGESVTEAMSDVDNPASLSNPTNEHSLRDYSIEVPWLGSVECGKTGFRFARIDLLDSTEPFQLRYVEARSFIRDLPDVGTFECSDPRLTQIWRVGAYTVKLNMQEYVWDGVKRDRLVWIGDMHPEIMTINTVWGSDDVVMKSLDYARDDTPLPGWMNGISSYSLWWLIIQRDLYLYQGDHGYLVRQHDYIARLVDQICGHVGDDGVERLDGQRFLDWPTSEDDESIHCGLQSLVKMALEAARDLGGWLGDEALTGMADACLSRMAEAARSRSANKQATALAILSGTSADPAADSRTIMHGGADRFSTFYGYYMLEALAKCGKIPEAMQIISDYWGAMLDLGATTFWEDLSYGAVANAGRIDGFVDDDQYDIHADGGAYCYKGLRLSLCHGWASGPTPWLTRHVLGITPLQPGCSVIEVNPHLGSLSWAKGTFPTAKGVVTVQVVRDKDGRELAQVDAPEGIVVVNRTGYASTAMTE